MKPEASVQPEREVGARWWCNVALCYRTEDECKELNDPCHQQHKAYCLGFASPTKVPKKYVANPEQLDVAYTCFATFDACNMGGGPCIGVE